MNTQTNTTDRRQTSRAVQDALVATARRIGQGRMTLEDLKALHAYRDLTLNYEHHVAIHELGEREHLRQHHLADDGDELHRLRTREAQEAEDAQREQEQATAMFDSMSVDRFDDLLDVTGLLH